jgi:hypothetical protein
MKKKQKKNKKQKKKKNANKRSKKQPSVGKDLQSFGAMWSRV